MAEPDGEYERGLEEQVLDFLAQGDVFMRTRLRDALAVNNERLRKALESLERAGRFQLHVSWRAGGTLTIRGALFRSPIMEGKRNDAPAAKSRINDLAQIAIDYREYAHYSTEFDMSDAYGHGRRWTSILKKLRLNELELEKPDEAN
jgi:hypothetical protein